MSVEKYRTFIIVAHCSTFNEAAEVLDVTPATVSKHISMLEKELGVKLFERTTAGVRLTKEGEVRLPIARRLVESFHSLMTKQDDRKLLLYSIPPPSRFGLSKILRGFAEEYPDIPIEIVEKRETPEAIEEHECELGIIGNKHRVSSRIECISIHSTRIGAILPAEHPLAKRKSISLSELRDEDFILPNPEIHVHRVYLDCCEKCGFTPKLKQTAFRDDSVLFYVANNQGVSLFTQEMLALYNYRGLVFMPLEEEYYSGGALAKLKDAKLSSSASAFWGFVRRKYQTTESSTHTNLP